MQLGRVEAGPEPRALATPWKRRLVRATFAIALFTVLRGIVNYVLQIMLAARFGATSDTDAYFVVMGLVFFVSESLIGVLTFSALPLVFQASAEDGEEAAWQFNMAILSTGTALFLCLSILLFALSTFAIQVLAPGFPPEVNDLAATLLRYSVPGFVFYSLALLLGFVLQSYHRFISTAIAPVLPLAGSVVGVVILPQELGILSVPVGFAVGSLVALIIQGVAWYKLAGHKPIGMRFRHRYLGPLRNSILPVTVAFFCSFLLLVVQRLWASGMGEGSVSALGYANLIIAVPTALLVTPVGTVLLPRFSELINKGVSGELSVIFNQALAVVVLTSALACALVLGLSSSIVQLLLQRGNFTAEDVELTAGALRFFGLGLFAVAASSILGRMFCAAGRVRAFAVVWVATVALLVLLDAAFAEYTQLQGLALIFSVAYLFQMVVLLILLARDLPGIDLARTATFMARTGLSVAISAWLSYEMYRLTSGFGLFFGIVAGAGVGTVAFVLSTIAISRGEVASILGLLGITPLPWSRKEDRTP